MWSVVKQMLARAVRHFYQLFLQPTAASVSNIIYFCNYLSMAVLLLLSLLMWVVNTRDAHGFLAMALTSLAALLAVFMGGVHWGIGLRMEMQTARFHFVWGTVVVVAAWLSVLMLPSAGLPFLMLIFIACYIADHRSWPRVGLEKWLNLRFQSTVVFVLSCLIGAAGVV